MDRCRHWLRAMTSLHWQRVSRWHGNDAMDLSTRKSATLSSAPPPPFAEPIEPSREIADGREGAAKCGGGGVAGHVAYEIGMVRVSFGDGAGEGHIRVSGLGLGVYGALDFTPDERPRASRQFPILSRRGPRDGTVAAPAPQPNPQARHAQRHAGEQQHGGRDQQHAGPQRPCEDIGQEPAAYAIAGGRSIGLLAGIIARVATIGPGVAVGGLVGGHLGRGGLVGSRSGLVAG